MKNTIVLSVNLLSTKAKLVRIYDKTLSFSRWPRSRSSRNAPLVATGLSGQPDVMILGVGVVSISAMSVDMRTENNVNANAYVGKE